MGSPLGPNSTKEALQELGMKMKKNGVAIDIIDYGTENRSNTEILAGLIESINTEAHPSRLVTIENSNNGIFLLDALRSKAPELFNRSGSNANSGGGMDGGDGFDFDPEMDPELAMALKLSMEEEMNRQKAAASSSAGEAAAETGTNANANENDEMVEDEEDEELMMARAIALSMEQAKEHEQN